MLVLKWLPLVTVFSENTVIQTAVYVIKKAELILTFAVYY